ncbi:histone-binding protein N1/N2-like isoform X2 [Ptychodera flava]|uniref:histone-binding protein N1/N2-like isoform X2 n=1 Tax=Ptychodera flava TaxID=63121 RepID=UPI00396A854A
MASTSAEPIAAETSSDIDMDALKLMGQGKRHLVMGEIPAAVNCFQEASELLGAKYGETATECGEAYFDYGKSLLELGRMETGVLGNALEGVPEEEEDDDDDNEDEQTEKKIENPAKVTGEEREKISDEVIDAMMKKDQENESDAKEQGGESEKVEEGEKKDDKVDDKEVSEEKMEEGEKSEEKESEKSEAKDDEKDKTESEKIENEDQEKPDSSSSATEKKDEEAAEAKPKEEAEEEGKDEEGEGKDEEGEGKDEGEGESAKEGGTEGEEETPEGTSKEESEDVSNFQLAWEMLELAKLIFGRQEGKENELRVAQCYLKLGEVALETENYSRSVEDFQACLDLQLKHLESENRLLAESHYQLGLAHSFNRTFDKAIEHFNAARKVIEDRLVLLTKRTEEAEQGKGKEKASTDDPLVADQKEMQDLKDLIPDIMAKIEDAEEMKKDMETAAKSAIEAAAAEFGVSSSSGDGAEAKGEAVPVQNISHLVRKKRKPEDDVKESAPSAEAKKPRSEENGSGDASTCVNGDTKVNGVNGVDNSTDKDKDTDTDKKEQKEIQTKTVEDVKKKEETDAAPMETA